MVDVTPRFVIKQLTDVAVVAGHAGVACLALSCRHNTLSGYNDKALCGWHRLQMMAVIDITPRFVSKQLATVRVVAGHASLASLALSCRHNTFVRL